MRQGEARRVTLRRGESRLVKEGELRLPFAFLEVGMMKLLRRLFLRPSTEDPSNFDARAAAMLQATWAEEDAAVVSTSDQSNAAPVE